MSHGCVDTPGLAEEVEPPQVSRRRAGLIVVLGLMASGVAVGALWAWLAPSVGAVIVLTRRGQRVHAYVGDETDHLFLGAFLVLGFLTVLAVVAAVLVWQWRTHRGPMMVNALAVGMMAAAGVAAGVGAGLARLRYGAVEIAAAPVSADHRVHYLYEASAVFFGHSSLQIAVTIVVPAGVAALVYALCAVATERDDLAAWPPVERAAVRVTDPAPTAADGAPVDPSSPSH